MTTKLQSVSSEGGTFNFQWLISTDDQSFTGGVTLKSAEPGMLEGDTLTIKSGPDNKLEITNDTDDKRQLTIYLSGPGGVQTVSLPPLSAEDWGKVTSAGGVAGGRRKTRARKSRRRMTRRRR